MLLVIVGDNSVGVCAGVCWIFMDFACMKQKKINKWMYKRECNNKQMDKRLVMGETRVWWECFYDGK